MRSMTATPLPTSVRARWSGDTCGAWQQHYHHPYSYMNASSCYYKSYIALDNPCVTWHNFFHVKPFVLYDTRIYPG